MAMNIRATPASAVLAGAWCALGMGAIESVQNHLGWDSSGRDAAFLAGAVVFLFVPVSLFVAGPWYFKTGWKDTLSSKYWRDLCAIGVRGLWWLFGGAVGFAILWLVEAAFAI
jgi:hypothetical protein